MSALHKHFQGHNFTHKYCQSLSPSMKRALGQPAQKRPNKNIGNKQKK